MATRRKATSSEETRRVVKKGQESVDYGFVKELNDDFERDHFTEDACTVKVEVAVLGNAVGEKGTDGIDKSDPLYAIIGRRYMNGKFSVPFTMEYARENGEEIAAAARAINEKLQSHGADIQERLSTEEKTQGKDVAMRTQAIRMASDDLFKKGYTVDRESKIWRDAIAPIKASSPAKLNFVVRVTIGGRKNTVDPTKAGLYNKTVSNIEHDGNKRTAYTGNADYDGLHKVPIYNSTVREDAEAFVMDFARIVSKNLGSIKAYDADEVLEALQKIGDEISDTGKRTTGGVYTDAETKQIETWKNQIVDAYENPVHAEEV